MQNEPKKQKRTNTQNKAMHKYFEMLAEKLSDAGYDVRKTLKHDFNVDWTPYLVKELLWKQLQEAMTGKTSTTQLTTKEVNQVYNQLTQILTSKFGVDVPFPSTEDDYGTENN